MPGVSLLTSPFPVSYRELYLAKNINGSSSMQSLARGSHKLTLTGSKKGTTTDGVRGFGGANSSVSVTAEAAVNNVAKLAIYIRFRFDNNWTIGSGTQYILTKHLDANNYIDVYFDTATGSLTAVQVSGGGAPKFSLASTTTSWDRNWHSAVISLSDTVPAQRMLIDGTLQASSANAAFNTPNGGDLVILNSAVGGVNGFQGTVSAVAVYARDLSTQDETNLNMGYFGQALATIPVYLFMFDTGLGTISYNSGTGANNGTLGSSVKWMYGQVIQPAFSSGGFIDYRGESAANICDLSAPCSYVWCGKMKTTYSVPRGGNGGYLFKIVRAAAPISAMGFWFVGSAKILRAENLVTGGGSTYADFTNYNFAIDDYLVLIYSILASGVTRFYYNGSFVSSGNNGSIPFPSGGATLSLQNANTTSTNVGSNDKTMLFAQINDAITDKQALAYTRWIKSIFNLPISV